MTKEKCKRITKKGERCRNFPMNNSDYCYMHSLGKIKHVPWWKNFTIHLTFLPIVLAIIGYYFTIHSSEKTLNKITSIEERKNQVTPEEKKALSPRIVVTLLSYSVFLLDCGESGKYKYPLNKRFF